MVICRLLRLLIVVAALLTSVGAPASSQPRFSQTAMALYAVSCVSAGFLIQGGIDGHAERGVRHKGSLSRRSRFGSVRDFIAGMVSVRENLSRMKQQVLVALRGDSKAPTMAFLKRLSLLCAQNKVLGSFVILAIAGVAASKYLTVPVNHTGSSGRRLKVATPVADQAMGPIASGESTPLSQAEPGELDRSGSKDAAPSIPERVLSAEEWAAQAERQRAAEADKLAREAAIQEMEARRLAEVEKRKGFPLGKHVVSYKGRSVWVNVVASSSEIGKNGVPGTGYFIVYDDPATQKMNQFFFVEQPKKTGQARVFKDQDWSQLIFGQAPA